MKRKADDLSGSEQRATLDALYTATSAIRGREDMKLFLRDLLTKSERIMLGRRILIARMLLSGKGYDDIGTELRVGNSTIRRVDRWLKDEFSGFEKAVEEMEKVFKARQHKRPPRTLIGKLKRKYPLYFLLFPDKG